MKFQSSSVTTFKTLVDTANQTNRILSLIDWKCHSKREPDTIVETCIKKSLTKETKTLITKAFEDKIADTKVSSST